MEHELPQRVEQERSPKLYRAIPVAGENKRFIYSPLPDGYKVQPGETVYRPLAVKQGPESSTKKFIYLPVTSSSSQQPVESGKGSILSSDIKRKEPPIVEQERKLFVRDFAARTDVGGRLPPDEDAVFTSGGLILGEMTGKEGYSRDISLASLLADIKASEMGLTDYQKREEYQHILNEISELPSRVQRLIDEGKVGGLFALADGAGGGNNGEIASSILIFEAVSYLTNQMEKGKAPGRYLIKEAFSYANDQLKRFNYYKHGDNYKNYGGSTLNLVMVDNEKKRIVVGNVGNSRAYLLDKDDSIQELTLDGSLKMELTKKGSILPFVRRIAREFNHGKEFTDQSTRMKAYLYVLQARGFTEDDARRILEEDRIRQTDMYKMHTGEVDLLSGMNNEGELGLYNWMIQPGDKVILCCDGVWEGIKPSNRHNDHQVHTNFIERIKGKTAKSVVETLTDRQVGKSSGDNTSAVAFFIN